MHKGDESDLRRAFSVRPERHSMAERVSVQAVNGARPEEPEWKGALRRSTFPEMTLREKSPSGTSRRPSRVVPRVFSSSLQSVGTSFFDSGALRGSTTSKRGGTARPVWRVPVCSDRNSQGRAFSLKGGRRASPCTGMKSRSLIRRISVPEMSSYSRKTFFKPFSDFHEFAENFSLDKESIGYESSSRWSNG